MVGTSMRGAWRAAFLRALARGGSVTAAARVAGVDKTTAYATRKRDAAFAVEWGRAMGVARARLAQEAGAGGKGAPRLADDECVRASRKGRPCIVRAGPGRWSAGMERRFLETLASDANVKRAAAEAGVSTAALYKRREAWPGFAERWDAALAQGYARIEALLIYRATATLEGEAVVGGEGAAPSFADAMNLFRLHRHAVTGQGAKPARGWRRAEPSIEVVHAELLRRIAAMGG